MCNFFIFTLICAIIFTRREPPSPQFNSSLQESPTLRVHTSLLVGGRVGVAWNLSGLAAEDSVKVGTLLVGSTLLSSVSKIREMWCVDVV